MNVPDRAKKFSPERIRRWMFTSIQKRDVHLTLAEHYYATFVREIIAYLDSINYPYVLNLQEDAPPFEFSISLDKCLYNHIAWLAQRNYFDTKILD